MDNMSTLGLVTVLGWVGLWLLGTAMNVPDTVLWGLSVAWWLFGLSLIARRWRRGGDGD